MRAERVHLHCVFGKKLIVHVFVEKVGVGKEGGFRFFSNSVCVGRVRRMLRIKFSVQ